MTPCRACFVFVSCYVALSSLLRAVSVLPVLEERRLGIVGQMRFDTGEMSGRSGMAKK